MKKTLVNYSKKIRLSIAVAMCVTASISCADENKCLITGTPTSAPKICGVAQQGGMLYGETNGWDVYVGDNKISNNGVFVIGLDRDAPDTLKLKFCLSGAINTCQVYSYPIAARQYLEQQVTVADKFIKYPPETEKRIERENAEIHAARAAAVSDTMRYFMNMRMPDNLKNIKISGVYGSRRVFNGVPKSPHRGLDFSAPAGTPVYPVANGTVILAADHFMNGNIIMLSHGHGVVSAYLHLSEIIINVGDTVTTEKVIGRVGSTGRSSGAHLHMGMYHGQTAIDPALFIMNKATQNVRD